MVTLGTNVVPFQIPCDSVNQTCSTDGKLKVLAVSNQGKMTLLKIAPTCICMRLETLPACGSKPRNTQDVGLISWQKQEAVVRNGVEGP